MIYSIYRFTLLIYSILYPNIKRQLKQNRCFPSTRAATLIIVRIEPLNNLTCIKNRRGAQSPLTLEKGAPPHRPPVLQHCNQTIADVVEHTCRTYILLTMNHQVTILASAFLEFTSACIHHHVQVMDKKQPPSKMAYLF